MGGKPRDRHAEEAAISAANGRLLAGTPFRAATGKLTVSELITESGLRRDIVYEHTALVDAFKAQAKAQQSTPLAMQQLTAARNITPLRRTGTTLRDSLSRLS